MHHHSSNNYDTPLEGYIVKLGRYVKSWNKRWMCIEGDSLNYYTPDKLALRGTIKLSDIIDVKLENDGHHHYPISNPNIRHSVDIISNDGNAGLNSSIGSNSSGGSSNPLSHSVDSRDKRASLNISSILNSKSNIASATTTTTLTSSHSNLSSSFSTTHFVNNHNNSNNSSNNNIKPINIIKEYIFSVKVPDRVYLFKTLDETQLHYWIQGIMNIRLENAIKQNELRENQRTSKKLTIDYHEVMRNELFYLRRQCKDLKKSLMIERNDIAKELDDYRKLMSVFQDHFSEYTIKVNLEIKALKNTCNNNINKSNNNLATTTTLGFTPPLNSSNSSNSNNSNNNLPKTKLGQVLWHPDESSSSCKRCKTIFGVFRRKHHCRNCGEIFCSKCTKKTCSVSGYIERVRVCDDCYNSIQLQFTKIPTYNSLTMI